MRIERDIESELVEWKNSASRKPILLKGARQIGKTWAIEEFGRKHFKYCVRFDFDRQGELKQLFDQNKNPERLINELSLYTDQPIRAGETLLIFDEIQECEAALNSLKYFYEEAPQYHIIAASSLLGVAVKRRNMTVPVGKVKVVRMYPITFREFLRASDRTTFDYVESIADFCHLPEIILSKLRSEYLRYQICGGMPEAVVSLLGNEGIAAVENALQDILDLYELDFAKYAQPIEMSRIHSLWHSLPAQLSKQNRKFVYRVIKKGARSKDYEDALMWLEDAGLIYRIFNISKPGLPLSAYAESDAFKVYAADCGLLRRLANLPASAITGSVANYTEFKGALAENAVLQAILPLAKANPYYWTSAATAEVEFVLQWGEEIVPIEVKAEGNINGNSLALYNTRYNPNIRMRFSMLNMQYNCGLLSCPLPLAAWADKWLNKLNLTTNNYKKP